MNEEHNSVFKLFSRRSFLLINSGLILLAGWGFIGELTRNNTIHKDIKQLQEQAVKLEVVNAELNKTADRYGSSIMLEREARLKLNLQRPGEEVVIVQGTSGQTKDAPLSPTGLGGHKDARIQNDPLTNIHQWIDYFFHK